MQTFTHTCMLAPRLLNVAESMWRPSCLFFVSSLMAAFAQEAVPQFSAAAPAALVAPAPSPFLPSSVNSSLSLSLRGANETKRIPDCQHGDFIPDPDPEATSSAGICKCHEGWGTAGITDTIHFLQGVCSQYHCTSNNHCVEMTGVEGAVCPIHGWNCYCGWKYAFANGGTGWESPAKDGHGSAKCTGVMYSFSIWTSEMMMAIMEQLWKAFVVVAALLLPFGRKRIVCHHHRPSIFRTLRNCFGCPLQCSGDCILNDEDYRFIDLFDDFAWSYYCLELMVWSYLFCFSVYIIALFLWSVILWAMVVLLFCCVCVIGCCTAAVSCGADCIGSCNCDGCCSGGCDLTGCSNCLDGCFNVQPSRAGGLDEAGTMYRGGPYPFDPFWGYGGYGYVDLSGVGRGADSSGDPGCTCQYLCLPFAYLFYVFPVMPENMWGGLVGWFMGTHRLVPEERRYWGNAGDTNSCSECIIEALRMGWRRRGDLHHDDNWRDRVYRFLTSDFQIEQPAVQSNITRGSSRDSDEFEVMRIGNTQILKLDKPFTQDDYRCVESTFEDYENNCCWICRESRGEWDLWMSCRHLFCEKCSTTMLARHMPCPLCRTASDTAIRAPGKFIKPHDNAMNGSSSDSGYGQPLLGNGIPGLFGFNSPNSGSPPGHSYTAGYHPVNRGLDGSGSSYRRNSASQEPVEDGHEETSRLMAPNVHDVVDLDRLEEEEVPVGSRGSSSRSSSSSSSDASPKQAAGELAYTNTGPTSPSSHQGGDDYYPSPSKTKLLGMLGGKAQSVEHGIVTLFGKEHPPCKSVSTPTQAAMQQSQGPTIATPESHQASSDVVADLLVDVGVAANLDGDVTAVAPAAAGDARLPAVLDIPILEKEEEGGEAAVAGQEEKGQRQELPSCSNGTAPATPPPAELSPESLGRRHESSASLEVNVSGCKGVEGKPVKQAEVEATGDHKAADSVETSPIKMEEQTIIKSEVEVAKAIEALHVAAAAATPSASPRGRRPMQMLPSVGTWLLPRPRESQVSSSVVFPVQDMGVTLNDNMFVATPNPGLSRKVESKVAADVLLKPSRNVKVALPGAVRLRGYTCSTGGAWIAVM
mmetsp:Transcript_97248/g.203130  ORF Transcript_97248/g.203130 Transcript_97248/m.203130 type:complete len:1089 (-) Transcript_97248:49-3315(-)